MRFRRVAALLGVAVFAQLVATAPPKVPSAKWAQTIDGIVFVTIQLKRGGSQLCEGEEASIVPPDGLRFQMFCVGEAWALSIELPHGVEDRVAIRRERAQVVLSLKKLDPTIWWQSLAKYPEKFKTLLQRDTTRGDPEPDPDELSGAEASAMADDPSSTVTLDSNGQPIDAAEARRAALDEKEYEDAMKEAQEELKRADAEKKKVRLKVIKRLRALKAKSPKLDDMGRISVMLGYLLVRRGEVTEAEPLLINSMDRDPDFAPKLLQSISGDSGFLDGSAASITMATRLYEHGTKMFPSEAEYQYQLGRMHQMARESTGSSEGEIGGKSDAACRAWRSAIELKPDMAEAYQMLALRLSRSSKKKKKLAAQNLAKRALKLAPDLPVSYVAVGMAYARQHADTAKLKASVRSKAIEAYSKALSMDDDGAGDKRLTAEYRAETSYHLGMLYAVVPKDTKVRAAEALHLFREAARLMPAQPHYTEAAAQLEKSTEDFLAAQRRRKAEEEERQQQELRQQEDKAWEEDGEDAVW